MLKHSFTVLLLCSPFLAYANPQHDCKKKDFLNNGVDLAQYKQCSDLLHRCPVNGTVRDQTCIEKTIEDHAFCQQLGALAKELNAEADALTIEKTGKLFLVEQFFSADGKYHYHLIASNGCLIDTNMDPREISPKLKKRYKNKNFMIANEGKPASKMHANGSLSVSTNLKITDTCMACEVIGYAKVKFDFSKEGELKKIDVEKFKERK